MNVGTLVYYRDERMSLTVAMQSKQVANFSILTTIMRMKPEAAQGIEQAVQGKNREA